MPVRKLVLTVFVVGCLLAAGAFFSTRVHGPLAHAAVLVSAGLFALAVIRSSLLKPLLVARRWRDYAAEHGYRAVLGRHGEPRMVGQIGDSRFILAQSTELLGGGGGYYARTAATATIESGVPDGLRVYRRDALEWMHQLSGLREIEVDPKLDELLMIEGANADETRSWVRAREDVLLEIADAYPRFILYGAEIDGLPVAGEGASGAITLLVVGRKSRRGHLDELIGGLADYAARLGTGTTQDTDPQ